MHFRAVAVDDDINHLNESMAILKANSDVSEVEGFLNPAEALSYISSHFVPVVLLDIRMPGMDGLTLAERIQEINPRTNVIFVTTYSHYLPKAFSIHASGYIMKPITEKKFEDEVRNLRFLPEEEKMGFYARTFGSFSLSYDGEEIAFSTPLEKEMAAFFVDRNGKAADIETIGKELGVEEKEALGAIYGLMDLFSSLGEDGVIIKTRKGFFFDSSMIASDLSEALDGIKEAKDLFMGDYLSPYPWAKNRQKELSSIL